MNTNDSLNGIAVEGEGMNALMSALGSAENDDLPGLPVASTSGEFLSLYILLHFAGLIHRLLDITTTDTPAKKVKGKYSKWRPSEDAELTKLVLEHGPKDWHFIAKKLTITRSADSTCGRWTNFLYQKQQK